MVLSTLKVLLWETKVTGEINWSYQHSALLFFPPFEPLSFPGCTHPGTFQLQHRTLPMVRDLVLCLPPCGKPQLFTISVSVPTASHHIKDFLVTSHPLRTKRTLSIRTPKSFPLNPTSRRLEHFLKFQQY